MDAAVGKPLAAFGFLTILESAEHGLFGGYLVLSPRGRPLEFRCSTPIVASRAQEILYGPTLRPYLLAEVIGAALVESASLPVQVILTDLADVLQMAELRPEAVLLVEPPEAEVRNLTAAADHLIEPSDAAEAAERFAGCRLRTAPGREAELAAAVESLAALTRSIELAEPFQRIRAALAEAESATQNSEEPGDDLAAAA